MKRITSTIFRKFAGVMAGALLLTACAGIDAPTAPRAVTQEVSASPLLGLPLTNQLTANLLGRPSTLTSSITATATIGKAGGVIRIPAAGFTLVVPAGAVSSNVKFTVTAMAGNAYAYDFAPHGKVFNVPLKFQQSLGGLSLLLGSTLKGGYFANNAQVDTFGLKAILDEVYNATVSNGTVIFDIKHFSGYLVSMG